MQKVSRIIGTAYPEPRADIDTDQIIPARWLKKLERVGFEDGFFELHRREPKSVFNDPRRKGSKFLVVGENYGCGSSREIAVYAMRDFGIRAVIAPSIADIHKNNLPQGSIVPAIVALPDWSFICHTVTDNPKEELILDLDVQTITVAGKVFPFSLSPTAKNLLLSGKDAIDVTLEYHNKIEHYEQHRAPWLPHVTKEKLGNISPITLDSAY